MLTFKDFLDNLTTIITNEYNNDPDQTLKLIFSKIVKNKIKSRENRKYIFGAIVDNGKGGTGRYMFNYNDIELTKLYKNYEHKPLTNFNDVEILIYKHLPAICDYLEQKEFLKLECSLEKLLVFYYRATNENKCA